MFAATLKSTSTRIATLFGSYNGISGWNHLFLLVDVAQKIPHGRRRLAMFSGCHSFEQWLRINCVVTLFRIRQLSQIKPEQRRSQELNLRLPYLNTAWRFSSFPNYMGAA
jgi:hypothetical protein